MAEFDQIFYLNMMAPGDKRKKIVSPDGEPFQRYMTACVSEECQSKPEEIQTSHRVYILFDCEEKEEEM